MKKAFEDDIFAVVDLETTGTQRKKNDRIIQFGCAIIKKRRVIKTYSFMINPHHRIPQVVQNLTGISESDVKDADDFSAYANRIQDILKDTIFVAHNVNFDLPFLNYELVNAGLEPLTNKAIDTVELAQIVFPTYPSYKLKDLTNRLKIKHLNPHRADSDALVTAKLLLQIINKLELLPMATINTLISLSKGLIRDTDYIFSEIGQVSRQSKKPLPKNLVQIKNLVLKKTESTMENLQDKASNFPKNDADKKIIFKRKLRFRRAQVDLINQIHSFILSDTDQNFIVEAPNGSGKTFAYLFSYAYNLYSGRKLIVATPTKVLQEQILKQEIPQLLNVTGLDLTAQEIKSSSHYLDLDGFFNTIYQSNPDIQTLILQMSILVWLTETNTGDLDELQLTSQQIPIFNLITHPGDARVGTFFSNFDFWNLARRRQETADILITNHAYLANHFMDSIWGQNPYLVIDEAHRFAENVGSSRNSSLQFESFWGMLSHLKNLLFFLPDSIQQRFGDNQEISFVLEKLDLEISELIHAINRIQLELNKRKKYATSVERKRQNQIDYVFQGNILFDNVKAFAALLNQMQNKIEFVRRDTSQLFYSLYQRQSTLIASDDSLLHELQEQLDNLDYYSEQNYLLLDQLANSKRLINKGFILHCTNTADPLSTNISWLMIDPQETLKKIYQSFSKKLFISATLVQNSSFSFIENNLNLDSTTTKSFIGEAFSGVKKNLQILALDDKSISKNPNDPNFISFLAKFFKEAILNQNHVLALFTNLEVIKNVFTQLIDDSDLKEYELLAQGITGSNERIAKRFGIANKALLLGANSFWEGIDFKDCTVDLVIATKLPFESPDQPEVKLREEKIKNQTGKNNVFEIDTLPRAVIRFRQGCGRLNRNENDKGVFVILDQRILYKSYGEEFLSNLLVPAKRIDWKNLKTFLLEGK